MICFLLVQIAPGDPLTSIMPVDASAEQQAAMRSAYGLDKPLPVQYAIWVGKLFQGDMGRSIATGRPVASEVFGAVQNSLMLAIAAAIIAFPIGIFLGFLAGYFRDTAVDKAVTALSIAGVSVPNYWLGIVLVIIFSVTLGWLPSMGAGPGGSSDWSWDWLHIRHLVLPAVTLSVVPIGLVARTVRALAGDILSMDFVQALYAKGMSRADVLRHVARNAAATALSVMGLQLGYLLGGSILIETVFNWPGSGFLLSNAIFQRDLPLL
ncbi:MAG TPA: ABC transporter permease, partial [Paenirhodobacter sp.]